jgi:hypothetical protein
LRDGQAFHWERLEASFGKLGAAAGEMETFGDCDWTVILPSNTSKSSYSKGWPNKLLLHIVKRGLCFEVRLPYFDPGAHNTVIRLLVCCGVLTHVSLAYRLSSLTLGLE